MGRSRCSSWRCVGSGSLWWPRRQRHRVLGQVLWATVTVQWCPNSNAELLKASKGWGSRLSFPPELLGRALPWFLTQLPLLQLSTLSHGIRATHQSLLSDILYSLSIVCKTRPGFTGSIKSEPFTGSIKSEPEVYLSCREERPPSGMHLAELNFPSVFAYYIRTEQTLETKSS